MTELHCNVIRDLMPLYIDEVCSPETAALLDAHLLHCPACAKLCREMRREPALDSAAPDLESQRVLKSLCRTIFGIALAVIVIAVSFVANIGGAWMGGAANGGQCAASLAYIIFWGAFTVLVRKQKMLLRVARVMSWITFLTGIYCLALRLLRAGGFLSAFLSVFVSVPMYGLRLFLDWTAVYAVAAVLGLAWVIWTTKLAKQ